MQNVKQRRAVLILILVTLVYLVAELAYSANLLNVVSSARTINDLDGVEQLGRLLSGFAVALAFAGFFIHRMAVARLIEWVVFVIAFLVVIWSVSIFETSLIATMTEGATADQKMTAVYTAALRAAVIDGQVSLVGMETDLSAPDGKAFIALMPAITQSVSGVRSKLKPVLEKTIENRIKLRFSDFYDVVYVPSAQKVLDSYKEFARGRRIDPTLFINSHKVQSKWSNVLHYSGDAPLAVDADPSFVEKNVKPDFMKYEIDHAKAGLDSIDSFNLGGVNERQGDDAYKLLIAPAFALMFSIMGAIIHSLKIVNYTLGLARVHGAIRFFSVIVVTGIVGGVVWLTPSPVTRSPLFSHLIQSEGVISPASIKWTIQSENLVYPVASMILQMSGFYVGVNGEAVTNPASAVQIQL